MNTKAKSRYFKLAKNASEFSDFPRQHLGCIFVYKNKIIAVGWNTTKENPMQKYYNSYRDFNPESAKNSIHAEMQCLLKTKDMDIDWSKVYVFIYREFKNGKTAIAKPCAACAKALKDRGIVKIYHT